MEALRKRGFEAFTGGRMERAIQCFSEYLSACPEDSAVCTALGSALKQEGRFAEAVCRHQEALRLEPGSARVRSNLAATFLQWGRFGAGISELHKAVKLAPSDLELRFNLGTALLLGERYDAASVCLKEVVGEDPTHYRAFTNLGSSYRAMGSLDESVAMFETATRLAPDFAEAQWNLGLGKLTQGDYQEGWRLYEWRCEVEGIPVRTFRAPRWGGGEDPSVTLMVHAEQGLGDTFQFCRFLKRARARVGRLVFLCHPPLANVLVGVRGVDQFCVREESLPEFDFHLPLMSLPFVLGVRDEVDVGGPYLRAEDLLEKRWGDRLRESPGFKVGLCWRGNPGYRDDAHRSMELSQLTPLWTLGDVTFVNLQKDDVDGELKESGGAACILDWTAEMDEERGAFVDSAALLCGLDLLITSDTAIAHLAGAMGRPVWLLLPRFADWRWGGDEETTRWYPSMKIFRQRDQGDWGEVIGRVREALVVQLSRTSRS